MDKIRILKKSEILNQERMNDPMKARICIIAWLNDKDEVVKISTHEQWFEGSVEEMEALPDTLYYMNYGHYFDRDTEITQEIIAEYYYRCHKLFKIHLGEGFL